VLSDKLLLPNSENALPGRAQAIQLENRHFVTGRPLMAPYPELGEDYQRVVFGLGCFYRRRLHHCSRLHCWIDAQSEL
jgi:hypothetical protein